MQHKVLCLDNYNLNTAYTKAFTNSLQHLVPKKLAKLFLINNGLSDGDFALILKGLEGTHGLQSLGYIHNRFGPQSI